jgi:transcriptional regulator with XRE-family HTH domain
MKTTHEKIKSIRKQLNLTKQELAERTGLSLKMIEKIESGELDFAALKIHEISKALNVHASILLDPHAYVDKKLCRLFSEVFATTYNMQLPKDDMFILDDNLSVYISSHGGATVTAHDVKYFSLTKSLIDIYPSPDMGKVERLLTSYLHKAGNIKKLNN